MLLPGVGGWSAGVDERQPVAVGVGEVGATMAGDVVVGLDLDGRPGGAEPLGLGVESSHQCPGTAAATWRRACESAASRWYHAVLSALDDLDPLSQQQLADSLDLDKSHLVGPHRRPRAPRPRHPDPRSIRPASQPGRPHPRRPDHGR